LLLFEIMNKKRVKVKILFYFGVELNYVYIFKRII